MSGYRNTAGRVCRLSFYKQEFDRDVHVNGTSSFGGSRIGVWNFRRIFGESGQGLRAVGENWALDSPPGVAHYPDSWDGIRKRLVRRQATAAESTRLSYPERGS